MNANYWPNDPPINQITITDFQISGIIYTSIIQNSPQATKTSFLVIFVA